MCKAGAWIDSLDAEDTIAFDNALDNLSRADLYRVICQVYGKPFGLTALKQHINGRCGCPYDGMA